MVWPAPDWVLDDESSQPAGVEIVTPLAAALIVVPLTAFEDGGMIGMEAEEFLAASAAPAAAALGPVMLESWADEKLATGCRGLR